MLDNILFIKALLAHHARLKNLLGDGWVKVRDELLRLLAELVHEPDTRKLAARTNRLYRALENTPAESLIHQLFREAGETSEILKQQRRAEEGLLDQLCDAHDLTRWARENDERIRAEQDRQRLERERDREQVEGSRRREEDLRIEHESLRRVEKTRRLEDEEWQRTQQRRRFERERQNAEDKPDKEISEQNGSEELKFTARELARAISSEPEPTPPEQPPPASQTVTTHPNLLGDDYAYLGNPYHLVVKLSDQPQPGGPSLSAPELKIPVEDGEVVKRILVKLTAPDFDLDPSETAHGWMRELEFYPRAAASNAITFILRPQDRFEERYFSALRVQFVLNGQVLGQAARRLEVLRDDTTIGTPLSAFPPAPGYPLDERGERRLAPIPTPVTYRPDQQPAHFTVTLSEAANGDRLLWEIVSPYLSPRDFPEGEYYSRNLGAEEFVKHYLAPFGMPGTWPEDHMDQHGHLKRLSIRNLYSHLRTLRSSAPPQFWTLYALALERHRTQGGTPEDFTLLFITADTHVPWELMPVSKEVVDGKIPPLLGSAHRVGRWLLEVGTPRPETTLALHGLSVAAPTYRESPLPQAQKEKEFIEQRYRAHVLRDDADAFITFMETGQPSDGTGILHFAGHGDCCTDERRLNWLVLTNREALYDIASASTDLGNRLGKLRPTVAFFNACNVGRAAPGPLGSNGGWGRALLNQQYKGYIGPLWSVYDEHARDICQMFYTLALDERLPLGEVMRRIRTRFTEDNRLFTYLAYLYLGHPLATITYTPFEE